MHKDIMDLLKRMGLKDREGRIYLACLRQKDGLFIFEIARETKITRSTVDLTVRRLLKRGFLNKVKVGRRLRYFAQTPEALLFRQKQLTEDWEQVVPLLAKLGGARKDMEILYFEGAEGFRQAYEDALLNLKFATGAKRELLGFSSGIQAIRLFPAMPKAFIRKRIKLGVWYRGIAPREATSVPAYVPNAKELRAMRYLPTRDFPFLADMNIYADSVMIYSPLQPVGGVIIRNERVADSLRALFNLLWTMLPEDF